MKIISGGQTGADRGALEAARECGFETGGTAPPEYMTEDGSDTSLQGFGLIALDNVKYYSLANAYAERARVNVRKSDATLIFARDTESKGTMLTMQICLNLNKPLKLYSVDKVGKEQIANIVAWLNENDVKILNVAGNRESKAPGIRDAVHQIMVSVLEEMQ